MTIHLPKEVENSINAAVNRGHFPSVDDAMTEAARLLLERLPQEEPKAVSRPATGDDRPIWDVIDELRKSVPAEEFAKLPKDGAQQLDHYLYGSPKRPTGA